MVTAVLLLWATLCISAHASDVGGQLTHLTDERGTAADLLEGVVYSSETYSCSGFNFENNFHLRGTNLGGWLVIEPWITPSLFYQFLGATETWGEDAPMHVAMDCWTFCTALGPEEANKQLRRHWSSWVREEDIANLAATGIDTLRIPVADWMFVPYGPYRGCWDGAIEQLDRGLNLIQKYGLKAVIDIHTMKDSQNGLDNSGTASKVFWTSVCSMKWAPGAENVSTFVHWPTLSANWMGTFNHTCMCYDEINYANIDHALQVIRSITNQYVGHPAVVGIEAINEPWQFTPIHVLKRFYWDAYVIVRSSAPHWVFMMHDAFHGDNNTWGGFLEGCPLYAFDAHIYQAWTPPTNASLYVKDACGQKERMKRFEEDVGPIVVGEWSLATDNCALWINGFNDQIPGFPLVQCSYVSCPEPYMGSEQPGAPPDPNKGAQDPFGTGGPHVIFGQCSRGADWFDEQTFMTQLCRAKMHAFDVGHGWFFWNFRTEFEPRWDFLMAHDLGYFPKDISAGYLDDSVAHACDSMEGASPARHNVGGALVLLRWLLPTMCLALSLGISAILIHRWRNHRYTRLAEHSPQEQPREEPDRSKGVCGPHLGAGIQRGRWNTRGP